MEVKPGYKQTEIGMIPDDWEIKTLGDLSRMLTGRTPPTNDKSNYGHDFLFVGPGDLGQAKYIEQSEKMLSCKGFSKAVQIPTDSIMITCIGSTIGKVGVAAKPLATNQQINSIVPSTSYDSDFLYYILLLNVPLIRSMASEQAVPIINKTNISSFKIPCPPLPEQKRICEPINDIDSLITSIEKLIEKKKLIKQGVMQELLTGKRRLPGFRREWETKRYGDIFQFISSANYTREDLTDTGSIRYIHYGDIHTKFENYVDLSDASIPTIQDCKLKNYPLLETGDLIMVDASEDYSGVGKSVEAINPNGCKAISGLHTILLRDTSKTFADGYRAFIHSIPSVKAQLDFYATGMKVYSISKGNLAIIEIPVPPKNEQEAIVNALSSFVDEIKALEVRLAKSILLKKAMMQELLTGRIRLI